MLSTQLQESQLRDYLHLDFSEDVQSEDTTVPSKRHMDFFGCNSKLKIVT